MGNITAAILAPHEEDKAYINPIYNKKDKDPSHMGGYGGDGGSGGGVQPGTGNPTAAPAFQGPSTILPGSYGSDATAAPLPIPDKPVPTADDPKIAAAEKKVDEELQHGFAANILAGGMFQAPPELARNILLGN